MPKVPNRWEVTKEWLDENHDGKKIFFIRDFCIYSRHYNSYSNSEMDLKLCNIYIDKNEAEIELKRQLAEIKIKKELYHQEKDNIEIKIRLDPRLIESSLIEHIYHAEIVNFINCSKLRMRTADILGEKTLREALGRVDDDSL